jgi:hypothetical protein
MISYVIDETHYKAADLTALAGAPLASSSIGRPWFAGDLNQVVYATGAGHVIELSPVGSKWTSLDLTALLKAPAAATAPMLFRSPLTTQGRQSVVYSTSSGLIINAAKDLAAGSKWKLSAPSSLAHAPKSSSPAFGFATTLSGNKDRIVYESGNQVIELVTANGQAWSLANLTSVAGAPAEKVGTQPTSYPNNASALTSDFRVIYETASSHIEALSLGASNVWKASDLTSSTGAPLAGGGPRGYWTGYGGSAEDEIVYPTQAGHVEQISGLIGTSASAADLTGTTLPGAQGTVSGYDNNNGGDPETEGIVYRTASSHIELLYNL